MSRMNELFEQLGIRAKEANIYRLLLENGDLTATAISVKAKESRTNTYMILEQLMELGLVTTDESKSVRRYVAADPTVLRQLFTDKQQELKLAQKYLNQNLPELKSMYNLGRLKPGVVYLEGLKGSRV